MRDWFQRFAFLPTKMSNGTWVWLRIYYAFEESSFFGYSETLRKQLKKPQIKVSSIKEITETFNISTGMLAGMLGVTEKTLLSWETNEPRSSHKMTRLNTLTTAINYLVQIKPDYNGKRIFSLLINGRILIDRVAARDYANDSNQDFDGTISLISYINEKSSFPITLLEAINEAVEDFERLV